jgi:hypothetical protein
MSSSFQTRKQSSSSERGSRKKDHNIYWGVLTIFEFFKNSTRKKPRNQFRHRPISGWWGHRPLDSVARKLGILYSIFFKRKGKKNISNFTLFSTLLFNASINTFIQRFSISSKIKYYLHELLSSHIYGVIEITTGQKHIFF